MKIREKFIYLYAAILTGVLIARLTDWQVGDYIFKPLLMLSLGFYFWQSTKQNDDAATQKQNKLLLAAIFFSLVGDVFLMFNGYFIAGLGAFLVAHVFYIYAFRPQTSRFSWKSTLLLPTIGIIIYGLILLFVVLPNVNLPMKVPIVVYAQTIMMMLLTVLYRWQNVPNSSFGLVLVGAVLFVLSDSMIAVNKFVAPFPLSGFFIMATYGIGQYLIVEGFLMKNSR